MLNIVWSLVRRRVTRRLTRLRTMFNVLKTWWNDDIKSIYLNSTGTGYFVNLSKTSTITLLCLWISHSCHLSFYFISWHSSCRDPCTWHRRPRERRSSARRCSWTGRTSGPGRTRARRALRRLQWSWAQPPGTGNLEIRNNIVHWTKNIKGS